MGPPGRRRAQMPTTTKLRVIYSMRPHSPSMTTTSSMRIGWVSALEGREGLHDSHGQQGEGQAQRASQAQLQRAGQRSAPASRPQAQQQEQEQARRESHKGPPGQIGPGKQRA